MQYEKTFGMELNYKSIIMLTFLAIIPNILGMINIPTIFGFKIHTFQFVVFVGAALFGPVGGAVSGGFGSIFTSISLNNPYIAIGNIILGFFTGFFIRRGFGIIRSVLLAFLIQIPWLYITDIYLAGMPQGVVLKLIAALLVSNIIWALAAKYSTKSISKVIS